MAIIEVNNLGKKYYLGERMSQRSILDSLKTTAKMPYRLARTLFTGESNRREEFWALKDVSFKVGEGEVLGIIGRNGAGKSTLLKILSRIVAPTEGEVIMNGRVGSLLEVGTGFHPELTGRENIFMNGSLLGMSHAEISKHFDEIVDFSGIEKFLDTPVKFYSSGMYTRLAFSVAAHLRTEILIVDEVLAVGDSEFQKKCLNKMDSVAKSGRTILFVSHNMNAVRELCERGLFFKDGSIIADDNVTDTIKIYLDDDTKHFNEIQKNIDEAKGNQFISVYNSDKEGTPNKEFKYNEDINIYLELFLPDWQDTLELSFSVYDKHKRRVFTFDIPLKKYYDNKPDLKMMFSIPSTFLAAGKYSWLLCINNPNIELFDYQDDVCSFQIIEAGSVYAKYSNYDCGVVYPPDCSVKLL